MKNKYIVFIGMGVELVGLVLGSLYVGKLVDDYFSAKGVITILTLLLCLVSWFVHFLYLVKRIEKVNSDKKQA